MSGKNYKDRTNARLSVVQAIYSLEFNDVPLDEIIDDFVSARLGGELLKESGEDNEQEEFIPMGDTDSALFIKLLKGWNDMRSAVDAKIKDNFNQKWSYERTEKLTFAILRAAVTEMMISDIDKPVIINEYVNIAVSFYENGQEARMINALLDKIAKGM